MEFDKKKQRNDNHENNLEKDKFRTKRDYYIT